jgi:trimeric autotransporter adhesin
VVEFEHRVATVNASSGLVTAVSVGTATITATSEGVSGSATVTVSPEPVATVSVTLGDSSLTVGQTTAASAVVRAAGGGVLTGRVVTWGSSDTLVARVSGAGLVSAVGVGSAVITGTSEGVSGTVTVAVSPAPVASVTLSTPDSSLIQFDTVQVTAVLRDAANNVLTGRTIAWSSSASAIATVSSTGRVAAVGVGTVTITATSEGVSRTLDLTIAPAPVAAVSVTLTASSVQVGNTTQATAELRDARGNVLTGRTVVWSSGTPGVATVNATTGLVTAVSVGTASITATSEGVNGSATVTVTAAPPAPVASVTLSTPDSSLIQFDTVQVTAVLRDAANNVLTGARSRGAARTPRSRRCRAREVAAVGIGNATITATSEGVSQTLDLTIAPAPVAAVVVTLASSSVQVGNTTQATAELRDARNNVLTGRTITWASDNASIATVNATTGLVTAVAVGSASISATSEGVSGSATVTVTAAPPAPVASVTLSTPDSSLIQFDTVQVTAVLRDAANNVLTGRTITWSSSNAGDRDRVEQRRSGRRGHRQRDDHGHERRRESDARSHDRAGAGGTVVVTLAHSSVQAGNTTQATAELRDARNNVLTGRTITWASDNAPSRR